MKKSETNQFQTLADKLGITKKAVELAIDQPSCLVNKVYIHRNLMGVDLSRRSLFNADLSWCDLRGTALQFSCFMNTKFFNSNLLGINLGMSNVFKDHRVGMSALAYSSDSNFLLTGGDDCLVKLWDLRYGKKVYSLSGHTKTVYSVAFAPDGLSAASASKDCSILIWDLVSGTQRFSLKAHTRSVTRISMSTDNIHILSLSQDKSFKIWNYQTGSAVSTFSLHKENIYDVAFSRDGKNIAVGGCKLYIIDSKLGTISEPLTSSSMYSVLYSYDGEYLLSRDYHSNIVVWNAKDYIFIRKIPGIHGYNFREFDISPDSTYIAFIANFGVYIKSANSEREILQKYIFQTKSLFSLKYSPDGKSIAFTDSEGGICVLEIGENSLEKHISKICAIKYTPDGKRIITGNKDGTIDIWDIPSGNLIYKFKSSLKIDVLDVSPDGKIMATSGKNYYLDVWSLESMSKHTYEQSRSGQINAVCFSPDGELLGVAYSHNHVAVKNAKTLKTIQTFSYHMLQVKTIKFSLDGQFLVTGSADKTVNFFDIHSQKPLLIRRNHKDVVYSVDFSSDGKLLISAGADCSIYFFRIEEQRIAYTIEDIQNSRSVTLSPNKELIAFQSSMQGIQVRRVSTCSLVKIVYGELSRNLPMIAFDPGNRFIATGSIDRSMKVWKIDQDQSSSFRASSYLSYQY